ncbi:Restriction endonuclease subunit S [Vibrio chagasii]|nr:Restriction endonuclease subunit S [Vibrio chagasii]
MNHKTPPLRFPEYDGSWREYTMGSVITPISEVATEEDKLRLCSLTIEDGITPKTKRYERGHLVKNDDSAYKRVKPNEFAYNPMNVRFGAVAKNNTPETVALSRYYDTFIVNESCSSDFFHYFLSSPASLKLYNRVATGSLEEKKRVHFKEFLKHKRALPGIEEQRRVAALFTQIDKKIACLKESYRLLDEYKAGVIQQIMSQDIRFKDKDGKVLPSWNEERLDFFIERVSHPVPVESESLYREIGIRSHGKGIFHKDSACGDSIGNKRVFWVQPNALILNIVFAWERAVAVTSQDELGFIASHRFPMYLPKEGRADVNFLLYFFLSPKGEGLLNLASPGGAGRNKTLGQSEFLKLKVCFPSLEEQQEIVQFLKSLDFKMKTVVSQIEQTKQFKKGLLQQMFV